MHHLLSVLFLLSLSNYCNASTSSPNAVASSSPQRVQSSVIAKVLKSFFPKPVSKEFIKQIQNANSTGTAQPNAAATREADMITLADLSATGESEEDLYPLISYQEFYSGMTNDTLIENILKKYLADHQNVRIEDQVNCFFALFYRAPLKYIIEAMQKYSIVQQILNKFRPQELFNMITKTRFNASEIKTLLLVTERYTTFYWGQNSFLSKLRDIALNQNNYDLLDYTNGFPDEIEEIKFNPELLFKNGFVPSAEIITSIFRNATKNLAVIALTKMIYPKEDTTIKLLMPSFSNTSGMLSGGWNIGMVLLGYEKYEELLSILQSVYYLKNKCGVSAAKNGGSVTKFQSISDMVPYIPDNLYRKRLSDMCGIQFSSIATPSDGTIGLIKSSSDSVARSSIGVQYRSSTLSYSPETFQAIRHGIIAALLQ